MLGAALLAWYDGHRRSLPWRGTRDPYRIWIAEVMLQQTQVKAVIPYYESFIGRFPTVEALAAASLDEVLARWSGLGYYRRARQLYAAAREVVGRGGFPTAASALLELPGIGAYTAAAIASMAFGEAVPVLDGNVERVLSRRLGLDRDPKKAASRQRLLAAGARLLDAERPGDSNQALMELGATICRPRSPECSRCPLAEGCRARLTGEPERFPRPRRRRAVERTDLAVAVARQGDRSLLFRRPEGGGLLAGIWELPNVPLRGALAAIEKAFGRKYGGRWRLDPATDRVRHGITHHALVLHVHPACFSAGDTVAEGPEAAWVGAKERSEYPLSSVVEKILGG
jgi:A/G-specific adenine glycosylase